MNCKNYWFGQGPRNSIISGEAAQVTERTRVGNFKKITLVSLRNLVRQMPHLPHLFRGPWQFDFLQKLVILKFDDIKYLPYTTDVEKFSIWPESNVILNHLRSRLSATARITIQEKFLKRYFSVIYASHFH